VQGIQTIQRYSIPRTEQAPLVFSGTRLAFAVTYDPSPPETTWPDERCHDHATIVLARAHVEAELQRYDPLAHLIDLPSALLVDELSTAYRRLVSAVVAQLDVTPDMS
jgi:hypothetical protein